MPFAEHSVLQANASANRWAAQLEETAEMPTESWRQQLDALGPRSSALHVSSPDV